MSIITARSLTKTFLVSTKKPGIRGTLRHFFARSFSRVEAVDCVEFDIEPGEIVGFIGPNGAGKTTTLKMLCGLIHPSYGQALVDGDIPHLRHSSFLKKITFVMGQKQQLIWDLPPLDSFKVNAAVYGLTDLEARKRIHELANMLDIDDELKRPVRKLSLGQRMKAELMASLLHRPSVLFLDEPTLGLDVNAQIRIREFLSDYNKKFKATILLTSHYMADITSLSRRVILIHKGKIFYDGDLKKLTESLSPSRSVNIEFHNIYPRQELEQYGIIEEYQNSYVRFLIPREKLSLSLTSILNRFSVKDLEVTDLPIELLISELFKHGKTQNVNIGS